MENSKDEIDFMPLLLKAETEGDVTIICKDGSLKSHRLILTFRCEYFNKTLNWNKDSSSINLDCNINLCHMLLSYIYLGQLNVAKDSIKFDELISLMELSRMICFDKLSSYLSTVILKHSKYVIDNGKIVDFSINVMPKLPELLDDKTIWEISEKMFLTLQKLSTNVKSNGGYSCPKCFDESNDDTESCCKYVKIIIKLSQGNPFTTNILLMSIGKFGCRFMP